MNTHLYFAYGMNTHPEQMASRCPESVCLGEALLPGYRFVFRNHADVELADYNSVHGVLWQVSDDDLDALDILEGFPDYYLRQRVWVMNKHGNHIIAWVYTMADQDYLQEPSPGYLQMCTEGYIAHGVPTNQLTEALNSVF
jgi:gamma-glutamylcyclotransferase (GGCT)/AIG2-like uncharacterized protein YtfP